MTSRYILELNGTPSISPTNNSVVNIAGSGTGVPSNVAIDLNTLGTVGEGSVAKCEFDMYGNSIGYIVSYDENFQIINGLPAYPCIDNPLTGINGYFNDFTNIINNLPEINISDNTNAFHGHNSDTGKYYCKFTIPGYTCDQLRFSANNGYHFVDSFNNPITSTSGSISTGITEGITFTCGSNNDIKYNYNYFDVSFQNSCSNTDKSFLIFTPKSTSTGIQHLGNSINGDGSINSPFTITHIENQNGDFYIEPICDVDGNNKPVLLSVLDNVVLG